MTTSCQPEIATATHKREFTEEHKRNLSLSLKGRGFSNETRRKMSESHKGVPRPNHKLKVNCSGCGKEILLPPCRIKERNYCSFKCYNTHRNSKIISYCLICGKMIETFPSMIKHRGAGRYCSRSCQAKGHTNKIKVVCPICGKEFSTVPGQIKRGKGKFCSIECRSKNHALTYVGEKAAAWEGGISFEPYCPKFNREFRSRVRAFFGYKCLICGKTEEENGLRLTVHHVNYNKMACCDNSPKMFALLCHSCHSKTNHNRDKWNKLLSEIITRDYGGRCYYQAGEI